MQDEMPNTHEHRSLFDESTPSAEAPQLVESPADHLSFVPSEWSRDRRSKRRQAAAKRRLKARRLRRSVRIAKRVGVGAVAALLLIGLYMAVPWKSLWLSIPSVQVASPPSVSPPGSMPPPASAPTDVAEALRYITQTLVLPVAFFGFVMVAAVGLWSGRDVGATFRVLFGVILIMAALGVVNLVTAFVQ